MKYIYYMCILDDMKGLKFALAKESERPLKEVYTTLSGKADLLYQFVTYFNDVANARHTTICGQEVTLVEAHILGVVHNNPGVLATQIATQWKRSRSAISQIINRLEKKGLLCRKKQDRNEKNFCLFTTEMGEEVSKAHAIMDAKEMSAIILDLMEDYTDKELEAFFSVLESYTKRLRDFV